jgi:putative transport protein
MMAYFSKVLTSTFSFSIFIVFLIGFVGFYLGSIKIKGVQLGHAAVFMMALVFGHFGMNDDSLFHQIGLISTSAASIRSTMSVAQNIGVICFVTSVGFIAGPRFFGNLKKNAKSYVLIALVVIGLGGLTCLIIILTTPIDSAMAVGLLSGSLTTTPGFAAAQEAVAGNEYLLNEVTVGHGIAYPFGVLGVVLFVQIVPKLLRANMEEERNVFAVTEIVKSRNLKTEPIRIDAHGLFAFSAAVVLGVLIGRLAIPLPGGLEFSLGNTGGVLLAGLLFGHFGHIGKISLSVNDATAVTFREYGLMLFLIGSGAPGGAGFVKILSEQGWMLFVYGALMTLIPELAGYIFAKYVLHLPLLNNLGSITGGMTSTPGLGALIAATGTDDVTSAYAATYPVALVTVVLVCQFLVILL